MKKRNLLRLFAVLICAVIVTAALASCGSNSYDASNDLLVEEIGKEDGNAGSGSNLPTADEKGEMANTSQGGEGSEYEPKIIRTVTVDAETENFSAALKNLENKVIELGGYVEKSDVQNSRVASDGHSANGYASYVVRIPADKLDGFLSAAGEMLSITSSESNATDISGEYYDLEARINVLETEKALLEKKLSEATTTEKMITIEERLYDVIYEIESYKTALKVYDNKVAYSTVTINITEVVSLTPVVTDNSFGARLKTAVAESWQNFVAFCADALIFLVYVAPALVTVAVILAGILLVVIIVTLIVRKILRKSKAKKAVQ